MLRNDSPVRELEGLPTEVRIAKGAIRPPPVELEENGLTFLADPLEGQKTGWYFDQRENRAFAAPSCRGERVLDLYSYSASFGLVAAAAGAERRARGRPLAAGARARRGERRAQRPGEPCSRSSGARRFAALDELAAGKERFGVVIADPPAFVRSKKDLKPGLRGYRKLARAAATLVEEEGFLALACCSHNVAADAFADEVRRGLRDAGRRGRSDPPVGRRPRSSEPSVPAGIGLPKVLGLRADVNH